MSVPLLTVLVMWLHQHFDVREDTSCKGAFSTLPESLLDWMAG